MGGSREKSVNKGKEGAAVEIGDGRKVETVNKGQERPVVDVIGGGSKVESVNKGKEGPVVDIGGGSKVDICSINMDYLNLSEDDVRNLWDDVRDVRLSFGNRFPKAVRIPSYAYDMAACFRSNCMGDLYSPKWVVKILFGSDEDMPNLFMSGKHLLSCFFTNNNAKTFLVRLLVPCKSLMSLGNVLGFKLDDDLVQYPIHCVAHGSRIIICGRFSVEPSDGVVSRLPDLPPNSSSVLMVELGGKLYVLSFDKYQNEYSLYVLDFDNKGWLKMPQPPHLGFWFSDGFLGPLFCPAVVGTKLLLFVEARWVENFSGRESYWDSLESRVFCFDAAALLWTQLQAPSFCFHLPRGVNQARALVLNESNMNIMFLFDDENYRIGVHILELDDDDDFVKLIGYFQLPQSSEFTLPGQGEFVHIGARKLCFVGADVLVPFKEDPCLVVIPFEFDIDTSQENAKSFTIKFMPPRLSDQYPTDYVETGSFLL